MENRIIALVAEHLLNEQFRSKKQMANALGLQYRTLLNAFSGKCSSRCYEKVLNATLRYCCLLYTSPSPRDYAASRMPSSA